MIANQPWVLGPDVSVTAVSVLPTHIKCQFVADESDFVVTRQRSRVMSRVIDQDAAAILQEFKEPKSIVDAIAIYSLKNGDDPQALLEDALPVLQRFMRDRTLVPVGAAEVSAVRATLIPGEQFAGHKILRAIQVLEDSEVYQVRSFDGGLFALKCSRPETDTGMVQTLQREAAVLAHLQGKRAPRLAEWGEESGISFLLMEWIEGVKISTAAHECRRPWVRDSATRLLTLCEDMLRAYAKIHKAGVLHGDIHHNNIIVNGQGMVRLIDFGLAYWIDNPTLAAPPRAGMAPYFEPEYAAARVQRQTPPLATKAGEQYTLAVLVYYLLTGGHYREFSVESDRVFEQILHERPRTFSELGLAPWPEVESVLAIALAKSGAERFASVRDFAHCVRVALPSAQARDTEEAQRLAQRGCSDGVRRQQFMRLLGTDGLLVKSGLPQSPLCSVNFGAAGIAYALWRMSISSSEPHLLALADVWANRAGVDSGSPEAFASPELDLTDAKVGPVSLYHTIVGVHAVRALVSLSMGNDRETREALNHFVQTAEAPCDSLDATLGTSSALIGCAILLNEIKKSSFAGAERLIQLGDQVFRCHWERLRDRSPIQQSTTLPWFGIAHGWAGILYASLLWCKVRNRDVTQEICQRLDELAHLARPMGNGLSWNRGMHDNRVWAGWCHGSAGYVFLWTLAHSVLVSSEMLKLAEGAAIHSWENSNSGSSNLCCGLAGQAYAQLSLWRATGNALWLEHAKEIGERAILDWDSLAAHSYSLYRGQIGLALLGHDLEKPCDARMPMFELM